MRGKYFYRIPGPPPLGLFCLKGKTMSSQGCSNRVYGKMASHTRHMDDLPTLAAYMLGLLRKSAGVHPVPVTARFTIRCVGRYLELYVLGLPSHYLFAQPGQYSSAAELLRSTLEDFMREFNWLNPDDALDTRFLFTVTLIDEKYQRLQRIEPDRVMIAEVQD
ncbi:hypothetical protein SAMN04489726_0100 [Allokutzneria albata]|uniref:Uncharacterized protein n=1 Tax=Allokutzneria albata TaxID=211114 RepID=A0A1G9QZE2_ALLAB|nr:hypothetical protein SAMN04489726_0100 [Allokutzneria albata]